MASSYVKLPVEPAAVAWKGFTDAPESLIFANTVAESDYYEIASAEALACQIQPTESKNLKRVVLKLGLTGSPTGDFRLRIFADNEDTIGDLLGTSDLEDITEFTPLDRTAVSVSFASPFPLVSGTKYWAVMDVINQGTYDGTNSVRMDYQLAAVNANLLGAYYSLGVWNYSAANDEFILSAYGI